jgi:hypothetical protein
VKNLIKQRTKNDEVDPEIIEVIDHMMHAKAKSCFLFTLSTINPMKIPATEYEILKAGPDKRL